MAKNRGEVFADCPRIQDWEQYIDCDFKNEKDLCDYIDINAEVFANDVLEISYEGHKKEYYLGQFCNISKGGNSPRIDFVFYSEGGVYLVECKNPTQKFHELSRAIGQMLSYMVIAEDMGVKVKGVCLVITDFDIILRRVIEKFKLPIDVFVMSKTKTLKLLVPYASAQGK